MRYLNIPRKEQSIFVRDAKQKLNLTWEKFASFLGVSRGMIFFYARGSSRLPINSYIAVCQKLNVPLKSVQTIDISNKLKNVSFPIFSERMAEFLGILAGDGHLSAVKYEVSVSLDRNSDGEYAPYVGQLFTELFGLEASYVNQKNVTKCRVYSRNLVFHLTQTYGLVTGNKMGRLHIPKIVWSNNTYLASYLRGFFDTDGSFYGRRKTDAVVAMISCDTNFLQELADALRHFNFKVSVSGKSIYIYSKSEIHRFFKTIGSSSPKNLKKYRFYLENGRVPSQSEALTL